MLVIQTYQTSLARPRKTWSVRAARGFTLVDVFTSIAVIMVLIAILLPSLTTVRETARRVVCGSNVRQIGLGLAMYADDYDGFLPPSRFSVGQPPQHHRTVQVRATTPALALGLAQWDGMGVLFNSDYLTAPGVFYCPSHHGEHPYAANLSRWFSANDEVICNYQFRASSDQFYSLAGERALVSDSLRSQSDFNHTVGCNFMRADLSATWFTDSVGRILSILPETPNAVGSSDDVLDAWGFLDGIDSTGQPR